MWCEMVKDRIDNLSDWPFIGAWSTTALPISELRVPGRLGHSVNALEEFLHAVKLHVEKSNGTSSAFFARPMTASP